MVLGFFKAILGIFFSSNTELDKLAGETNNPHVKEVADQQKIVIKDINKQLRGEIRKRKKTGEEAIDLKQLYSILKEEKNYLGPLLEAGLVKREDSTLIQQEIALTENMQSLEQQEAFLLEDMNRCLITMKKSELNSPNKIRSFVQLLYRFGNEAYKLENLQNTSKQRIIQIDSMHRKAKEDFKAAKKLAKIRGKTAREVEKISDAELKIAIAGDKRIQEAKVDEELKFRQDKALHTTAFWTRTKKFASNLVMMGSELSEGFGHGGKMLFAGAGEGAGATVKGVGHGIGEASQGFGKGVGDASKGVGEGVAKWGRTL